MKKLILFLIVLLCVLGIVAGSSLWGYYAEKNPFILFNFLGPKIQVANDNSIPEDKLIIEKVVEPPAKPAPAKILITEDGFQPKTLYIKEGQEVVWKNKQELFNSMIMGMRELSEMKSDLLETNDYFVYRFSKKGNYSYVDTVVFGKTGQVIVE